MDKGVMKYVVINKESKECICTTNKKSVAKFLSISRSTVYRLLGKGTYLNTKCFIIFSNVPIIKGHVGHEMNFRGSDKKNTLVHHSTSFNKK
jgi:hypothetical protein